jgi:hypothetical protein
LAGEGLQAGDNLGGEQTIREREHDVEDRRC